MKKLNTRFLRESREKANTVEVIPIVSTKETTQPQDISLDQKVDRYLIQYERESIPQSQMFAGQAQPPQQTMPKAVAQLQEVRSLFKLLFEAEDPLADAGGGADLGGDLGGGGDDAGGGEAGAVEAPEEPPTPILNIQKFSSNVARLVSNYDVLIDPKTVILNRAYAYIAKNYNPATANEFMATMKKVYQLNPNSRGSNGTRDYYAGNGNLADAGSLPSGGGGEGI